MPSYLRSSKEGKEMKKTGSFLWDSWSHCWEAGQNLPPSIPCLPPCHEWYSWLKLWESNAGQHVSKKWPKVEMTAISCSIHFSGLYHPQHVERNDPALSFPQDVYPSIVSSRGNHLLSFPRLLQNKRNSPKGLCVRAMLLQWCPTLQSWDCSPPGFSAQGILQARIPEWVAISFTRGSSQPRDRTRVSLCLLHWQACSFPLARPAQSECLHVIWFLTFETLSFSIFLGFTLFTQGVPSEFC